MMRKTLLLLAFVGLLTASFAQTTIAVTNAPANVDVYDKYEVSFALDPYSNPYDPEVIDVYADFTAPDGRMLRAIGFYYEGYGFTNSNGVEVASRHRSNDCWKVRFTPDLAGPWSVVVHAKDQKGERQSATLRFNCQAKNGAEGFIRAANTQYLKREVAVDGHRDYHSFFPIGPNVAWYKSADYYRFKKPYGIYEYQYYIGALSGNANYMRVWANRFQYLSIYGPEHAIRENDKPVMYFDDKLNQKDAAELDHIVSDASDHGINLMLCFFSLGSFRDDSEALDKSEKYGCMPSGWRYNPYHTVLGLERPAEFFSDPEAQRVTRNMLRYYVARWGYATNLVCWELFNEVANIFKGVDLQGDEKDAIIGWHNSMAAYLRSIDPHQHLVSTSMGTSTIMPGMKDLLFDQLDIVQDHNYQNLQKAASKEQMSHVLYKETNEIRELYPDKPFFMGEYGLTSSKSGISNTTKDPKGVDLHNCLWSSLFSGSMGPGSFWYWEELKDRNAFGMFKPLLVFCKGIPLLSDTFTAATTGTVRGRHVEFPNNIATYYIMNATEDTLMGWCQDTAFCYQSLRRLTDEVGKDGHFVTDVVLDPDGYLYTLDPAKRPAPSYVNNRIVLPISDQPIGTRYQVRWFDSETGLELTDEATTVRVVKPWFRSRRIIIEFPSSIRDIWNAEIHNTFGDAVFVITKISD